MRLKLVKTTGFDSYIFNMALVMLPCDLPWWTSVQRHLKHLLLASSTDKLISGMLKIHEMCNISLDPEEDHKDEEIFKGFATFLEEELTQEERRRFMDNTLRIMICRALNLKRWKPDKGLIFSLQQQSDVTELDYNFISSLIAHAFFSTFPKRTLKTHPTLQDFNFTHFFKNLHRKSQRFKLRSLFYYFEWLDQHQVEGKVKLSRQVSQHNVMTSRQWLTIEDWQECSLPLCKLVIRHEGRPERCENDDAMRICFASSRLGGDVLHDGESQESLMMFMMPELLAAMLSVEALEDNEVLKVEGARMFTRFKEARNKEYIEVLEQPKVLPVCLMDAENFNLIPIGQWEEDNVLRDLNKSLLGFQQSPKKPRSLDRRLSPIGESISSSPEVEATVIIKQTSCSTVNSFGSRSPSPDAYTPEMLNKNDASIEITRRKCFLSPGMLNNRRGRFIVLGSSGERLPVTRSVKSEDFEEDSQYSSCNSTDDEFHSANDSFDDESEDEGRGASGKPRSTRYKRNLSTDVRRMSFASRLREALRREAESSTGDWSTDSSSYAVGISISGPQLHDQDIQVKRGGSVGFVLTGQESIDDETHYPAYARRDTGNSSKYSFSTEYTSELEEVYDQFNQWLDDPVRDAESGEHKQRELDSRDMAVIRFAGSLLKRTLSESFAGMPLTEGCANTVGMEPEFNCRGKPSKQKQALTARSLSLELAKHKHKLAAQLNNNVPDLLESLEEESFDTSSSNCTVNTVIHKDIKHPETNNNHNENGHRKSLKNRKRKMKWIVRLVTEAIEQTIECEPVTLRLPKSKLCQLAYKISTGGECNPIVTGNWGCGRRLKGNPQLKLMLQWLAASVAGAPALIYYTAGNEQLFKLDTIVRVVVDRNWTVGELTTTVLRYAHQILHEPHCIPEGHTLFDEIIGIEKCNFDD